MILMEESVVNGENPVKFVSCFLTKKTLNYGLVKEVVFCEKNNSQGSDYRQSNAADSWIFLSIGAGPAVSAVLQHGGHIGGWTISWCKSVGRGRFHHIPQLYGHRILHRCL